MHELLNMEDSLDDVKKAFGMSFKDIDFGITYSFPNSKFPEMAFFFDGSNKLREQFAYLDKTSLQNFKKAIHCDWKESEDVKDIAHDQSNNEERPLSKFIN